MRVRWKPACLFGCLSLGLAGLLSLPAARAQTDIPVANGSFEQPDPNSSVKPLGWFRRGFGSFQPSPNVADPVWEYVKNASDAYDGTSYVCLHAPVPSSYGNPVSWDLESTTVGAVNAENAGQGSLIPVTTGGLYEASVYVRLTGTGTGAARLRLQNQATNNAAAGTVTTGGLYDIYKPTNGWVKLTSGPVIARSNFMSPRLYGNSLTGTYTACFDKVQFTQLALPITVSGVVKKANGDPYPGVAVGINVATKNGMADPLGAVYTGADGRFTITFPKVGDSFVAQAWIENNSLSDNVPVNLTGDTTITYNPAPLADVLLGRPIVAVSSIDPNLPPEASNDGNTDTRWSDAGGADGGDIPKFPHYLVYDLGRSLNFANVKSAEAWWENARAGRWQIRVSDTPPDPAMYTPQSNGNNALALQYGTLVYDSGSGAADLSLQDPNRTDHYTDVVSQFAPGSGRYVMLAMLEPGPFPNLSVYEFKVMTAVTQVTGQVVDSNNQPIPTPAGKMFPGAYVFQADTSAGLITTDPTGAFSLSAPRDFGAQSFMAHALDPEKMYTPSAPKTVVPTGDQVSIGNLVVGGPGTNVIPKGAATDIYTTWDPTIDIRDESVFPQSNSVDHDFLTRANTLVLQTDTVPVDQIITPQTPLYYIVDMGSVQPINQIMVDWEDARPGAVQFQVATTYDMANRSGGNWTTVKDETTTANGLYQLTSSEGTNHIDLARFAQTSARYIRLSITKPGPYPQISIWEIQAGVVPPPPVSAFDNAVLALKIWGGLQQASSTDVSTLDKTGDNAISLLDAIKLIHP